MQIPIALQQKRACVIDSLRNHHGPTTRVVHSEIVWLIGS
jgi:hypothetical protein